MTFDITPFSPGDEDEIASIERECFSVPWSAAAVLESYRFGAAFFVARSGGRIIGYGGVGTVPPEFFITNIAITERFRRRGAGRALTARLIEFAALSGASAVLLEVRVSNKAARRMYESLGFKEVGRRKNFYTRPAEDALIMTLELKKERIP